MFETLLPGLALIMGLVGSSCVGGLFVRRWQEKALRRRCSQQRALVLTYDDGPGRELTPRLLEMLDAAECKATFFLLGCRIAGNEQVVDRLVRSGHEVGCHGHNHLNAWKTWPWRAVTDMRQGYQALRPWAANGTPFRPPYGKLTLPVWWDLRRRHAPVAWWTIVSGDTFPVLPRPESVAEAVMRSGGGVVLMHDFDRQSQHSERAEFVLRTTELLLETAKREGLTVCRYGDLWMSPVKAPAS